MITIVIPVLNDNEALLDLLTFLENRQLKAIVVDGAASSVTQKLVSSPNLYIASVASRGLQIAAGIERCSTPWVWVLHADSQPTASAIDWLLNEVINGKPKWGRFDVSLPGVPLVAGFMNWRSRLTKICTGDQGMFFHQSLLQRIGGFPTQPLMEDIEISTQLKKAATEAFCAPKQIIVSSPRRWLHYGWWPTVSSMWWYRWLYFRGESAQALAIKYYGPRS